MYPHEQTAFSENVLVVGQQPQPEKALCCKVT
jgi:hypothetical protein